MYIYIYVLYSYPIYIYIYSYSSSQPPVAFMFPFVWAQCRFPPGHRCGATRWYDDHAWIVPHRSCDHRDLGNGWPPENWDSASYEIFLKFLGTVHLFKFLGGTTDELRSCFRKISEVKIEHLWKHQKNVRYQNIEGPQMAGRFFGSRVENSFCWITTSRSDGSDENDHDDGARIRKGWWLNSSLFRPFSCWA